MKRIAALMLTTAMIFTIAAIPTLAENADSADAAGTEIEQSTEQTGGEAEAVPAEPAAGAEGESEPAEPAPEVTAPAPAQDPNAPLLTFDSLRDVLTSNNYNVRTMNAQISELNDLDSGALKGAVGSLKELKNSLSGSLMQVTGALSQLDRTDPANADLLVVYSSLATLLSTNIASVEGQIGTMEGQIAGMDKSVETGLNSLSDGINQIVKGAETLYIGIVTMEAAVTDVERGLETIGRAAAIVEKQQELGMASAYDVESIHHQRSVVESQLESLRFQIRTSKITLESLCGLELSGTVRLGALTMPTAEEIAGVDYEGNLRVATGRNVAVMNADADAFYDESDGETTSRALIAAKNTFASGFKIVCMTVEDKARLADAAEESVAFAKRTYDIAAQKYELGMVSYEEYMAAQSEWKQAQSDLYRAQLDLFGAYRNYIWARDYGIA